jgi:hypothetical protein
MEITCPSGLVFEGRRWNNEDTKLQMDPKLAEAGVLGIKMVERAAGKVVSPGPYPFEPGIPPNLAMMSNADITAAAVGIRAATEPVHEFDAPCQGCAKLVPLTQDLREVEIYPASEDGITHLKTGQPVVKEIDGHIVALKLIRGSEVPQLAQLQAKDEKSVIEIQVCMSIESLTTPDGKVHSELRHIRHYWRSASWALTRGIEETINELEGGPDLYVEFRCNGMLCQREQVTVLPLDMAFFGIDAWRAYRKRKRAAGALSSSSAAPGERRPTPED